MSSRSTSSSPSRLSLVSRAAVRSVVALALALGALTAPTLVPGVTPRAQAAQTQIGQGTVTWGIKESWRTYIGVDQTTLDGGVTRNTDGSYDWPVISGTFDDATNSLRLELAGSVRFVKYPVEGGYTLDSLFKDLTIVITPTEQVVRGTYSGNPREGGAREERVDVVLATVDIASAGFASTAGQTTWTGAKTFGAEDNGLYPPGTPFDPLTVSYTGPGGIPDTGEKLAVQGVPTLTPGARWMDDNAVEDGRALFVSQQHDVLHLVQRSGFGTAGAAYVVRALDAATMQELGRTDIDAADARQWFQLAFDPATDALFLADGDPDSTGARIHRVVYNPATHTYDDSIVADIAPIDAAAVNNEIASLGWDATRAELIVVMKRTDTANRRFQGRLSFLHAPTSGSEWTVESHTLSLPDAAPVTGTLTTASGFSSAKTYASSRVAVLRDGSYLVVPGGSYRRSGSTDTFAIPALHLTRDAAGIALTYVPGTAIPPQSAVVANNFAGVTTAADGAAMMYGFGSAQYVDVVDGQAAAITAFAIPAEIQSTQNAAVGDPVRGVDYVFFNGTLQLTAWVDHELTTDYRFEGVNRGGLTGFHYPLAVTKDGAVTLVVKDATTGNVGLQRFDLLGITPTVATQPEPTAVTLGAGTGSEQVSFTSTSTGGTGHVRRQWQAKAPGATAFADLVGETAQTLTVTARPGMDGTEYRATYTNDAGRVASQPAFLAVDFSPRVLVDTRPQTVTEGVDAIFHASVEGNPAPTLTWQRRVDGYWHDVASDDDVLVETTDGVTTLTVTNTNTDQTGSLYRVKAVNDVATTLSTAARLTVEPRLDIPAEGLDLTGVTFEWSGSAEMQAKPPLGSSNYFSAGVSAGDQATYAAVQGDVSIVQVSGSGTGTPATYATRARHVTTDGVTQVVRLADGAAHLGADGSATVAWDGAWSVNFYDGLVPFTLTDPELHVDADGNGALTADLSGYAASMSDPNQREPLPPVPGVTIATFSDVALDPTDEATITPDFAGVELTVPSGHAPQNRTVPGWGSWPQEFVDFHFQSGLSSYWYSSGGSADAKKPAAPFTVDFASAGPGGGDPEPTAPAFTAQPGSLTAVVGQTVSLSVTATGTEPEYQWQKQIGSLWIDLSGQTAGTLTLAEVTTQDAGGYRVRAANRAGRVTSSVAVVTVTGKSRGVTIDAPATRTFGQAATVTVTVPQGTGQVTLAGAERTQTAELVAGTATFTLPKKLAVQTYALRASYSGDASSLAATAGRTLTVTRAKVTVRSIRLTRAPAPSRAGRVTADLAAASGVTVTGRALVTLTRGDTTHRIATRVRAGHLVVDLPSLADGTWKVTVTYRGTPNLTADTGAASIALTRR